MRYLVVVLAMVVGAVALLRGTEATVLPNGQHWAGTTLERTIGVDYPAGMDTTTLKRAMDGWSQSPFVQLTLGDPVTAPAVCVPNSPEAIAYPTGRIIACPAPGIAFDTTWVFYDWPNFPHVNKVFVYNSNDSQNTWCHELGHALGLDETIGLGCMRFGDCPSLVELADIVSIYSHVDSFDGASPVAVTPNLPCLPPPTPTPTNTPNPCPPGQHKKGLC